MDNQKSFALKEKLKVILTDKEIREAGSSLAMLYAQISTLEDDKKTSASDFKARIDAASAQATVQSNLIRNGYDYKDIDCEEIWDYDEKVVSVVRLDTGEQIRSRIMTAKELQQGLFPDKEESN